MKFSKKAQVLACFAACTAGSAMAAESDVFTNIETSVQYSYGFNDKQDKNLGYGSDGKKIETLRFQHENDWSLGSSMILFDKLSSDKPLGGGSNVTSMGMSSNGYGYSKDAHFAVAGVEVLGSKAFGTAQSTGLFKDWGISARYEHGSYYNFRAHEIGPQVHLNVPGFDRFKITWWQRWKKDDTGTPAQARNFDYQTANYPRHSLIGVDWRTSWQMMGKKWTSQAFIRYQMGQNNGVAKANENANGVGNRLWVEPDIFVYLTDNVALGLRAYYQYDQNYTSKRAGSFTNESKSYFTPNVVLKYEFK